ncbi:hypothetical protein CYFUS_000355 [Cystobacter fuscus]|uniref:Uncharacterized protein n=1 Tax=Cystobacter fuscus TaxID=43 RepID=A0A250IUL3_9BACT|nr:hypothetical protein [Cystobacter fuscus]ATB34943.1 hypothetical protein CYFUS_000355 [Cystobacter fuscus]
MKHSSRNVAWLGVPLVVLGLLLPRTGHASDEGEVRAVIVAISRLYEEFEYERALAMLQLARSLPRGPEDESALSLYEGILLCETGQFAKGETAFRTALLMKPGVSLPVRVAPKIDALFGSIRQELALKTSPSIVVLAEGSPPLQREQVPQASSPGDAAHSPAPIEPDVPLVVPVPSGVAQLARSDVGRVVAKSPVSTGLVPASGRPLTDSGESPASGTVRKLSLIPTVAGVLLVGAGAVSWSVSQHRLEQLRNGDSSLHSSVDVQNVVSSGRSMQTLSSVLFGASALAFVSAAGMILWGEPAPKPLSLGLSVDGSSAFVQGRWP